jgi:lipopolysaccharide/colanic/teichoic acid biosynthesis glycosyltransferase
MLAQIDTRRTHTFIPLGTSQAAAAEAAPGESWYAPWKVVAEYLFALGLFVLALPVMLVVMALVKLTSRGPALYKQTRLGKNGQPFSLYKVRTMVNNCERVSGAQWSRPGDPRITRLGAFLRRTHLDELPQLWNVLKGEMSLVGPRPERPEFVPALAEAIPCYRERLLVRPGVTGLAQVNLPPDTDLESVRQKLTYDLHYVYQHGPWLDVRIVLATALKVFGVPLAWLGRAFCLPGRDTVESGYRDRQQQAGQEPVPLEAVSGRRRAEDSGKLFGSGLILHAAAEA